MAFEAFRVQPVIEGLGRRIEALHMWDGHLLAALSDGGLLLLKQQPQPGQTRATWQVHGALSSCSLVVPGGFAQRWRPPGTCCSAAQAPSGLGSGEWEGNARHAAVPRCRLVFFSQTSPLDQLYLDCLSTGFAATALAGSAAPPSLHPLPPFPPLSLPPRPPHPPHPPHTLRWSSPTAVPIRRPCTRSSQSRRRPPCARCCCL